MQLLSNVPPRVLSTNLVIPSLQIIHVFAEAKEDTRIFMAKWNIKDGFWRLDAEDSAEWNFAYDLPQHPSQPC